ncbi:MAG TPA: AraC family transcriptional regulator [Clostridiaceae bacterium]|nr:AraC family transcriptional regulator [Clostridiaceae bacterium]
MSFFEPKRRSESLFVSGTEPRLVNIFKVNHRYLDMPRIMHKHDDRCELIFVVKGNAKHIIGGRQYSLISGDLAIYNAGVLHEEFIDASQDMVVYSLGLSELNLVGLPPNCMIEENRTPVINTLDQHARFSALLETIYEQVSANTEHGAAVAHYFLLALIALIHSEQRLPEKDNIDNTSTGISIKEWLDQHYQEDITLQDISDALFLSTYHISRSFKTFSGYTPTQYIARRRIGEAQSLLIHTDMSILDIALHVGYNSNSLFSRTFKSIVGRTPGQYRKDVQK